MRWNFSSTQYDPYSINNWEYIEWKLLSDNSWNLYLNTDWFWFNWESIWYNWLVYINLEYVWNFVWYSTPNLNTSWWWSPDLVSYITIATWLSSNTEYSVRIVPKKIMYWRARALSSPFDSLTEIVYDASYIWFWKSTTDTWHYFKYWQYYCCNNLLNWVDEVLPDTVTTIWNNFMAYQYWFKWLEYRYWKLEVMPNSVVSIWDGFREKQYTHTNVSTWWTESFSNNVVSVWSSFRASQYRGSKIIIAPDEVFSNSVTSIWSMFRSWQYNNCTYLTHSWIEAFTDNATNIWWQLRNWQYQWCWSLKIISWIKTYEYSLSNNVRDGQFSNCWNSTTPIVVYINWDDVDCRYTSTVFYHSLWLSNDNVYRVIVNSNLIDDYQNASWWSEIDDWKFWDVLDNYIFETDNNLSLTTESWDNIALEISDTYYH